MVFLGIYRAVYDYIPQGEGELAIQEGDLLFVLEKSKEDDWWRAKKKANIEDEEEPEGLIPNNYVEEAKPLHKAKALYDYTRQTDEELSFSEDATLNVYDSSDPDWTLVGLNGEFGFVPANYIEEADASPSLPVRPRASIPEPEPDEPPTPSSTGTPTQSPAVALAGILAQKTGGSAAASRAPISPPPAMPPRQPQYTPEESDEEPAPILPRRPPSEQLPSPPIQHAPVRSPSPPGVQPSPPYNRAIGGAYDDENVLPSPGGFHLYNIHEMISHNGKNRKMPCTLGVNIAKGIIMIAPEKSRDGPQVEWTAEKLTHYSIEGKHVFLELVRPSRSIDFHAGAKDTAHEIVSGLGEIAGAARAEGLREVLAASSGSAQKKGQLLFDFMAQGEDEVTVAAGDEVIVLDDAKSDEWWMVRRLKNGKEGVVPSNYVEITGSVSASGAAGINAGRSTVEQNRLDEERLTRNAARQSRRGDDGATEVGPGLHLPQRQSSLAQGTERRPSQRGKRESRDTKGGSGKASKIPEPDSKKVRTWTDRSGSFKVEAEYIGLRDGKIHLHKLNGVKIAVPVQKMAVEDLEYVEAISGVSLEDDKPLSSLKRRESQRKKDAATAAASARENGKTGISVEQPKKPTYDWFDFFLQAGVNPQICQRYANAFDADEMGEENQQDITPELLRTLGLKEGDILRVMRLLDSKFNRTTTFAVSKGANGEAENANGDAGGLFSGAGGTLRNNTRRGRPTPTGQTNDVVDGDALKQKGDEKPMPSDATATPLTSVPKPAPKLERRVSTGFEDNAWEPRQVKQSTSTSSASAPAAPAQAPAPAPAPAPPSGALGELSSLSLTSPPLQPTQAPQPAPQPIPQQQQFTPQQTGIIQQQFSPQQTGVPQQQFAPPRQRPQVPQQASATGGLIAPPPQRAASVPNPPAFAPPPALQPQLTGFPGGPNPNFQTHISPPGQSLQDLNQQRLQQNFLQSQPTGFGQQPGQFQNGILSQPTGYGQFQQQGLQPQPTGFGQPGFLTVQQQLINGQQNGSPFADPNPRFQPQPTGFQTFSPPPQLQPQQTGINSFLPPALTPQRTGISQFGNGLQGFSQQPQQQPSFGQQQQIPQPPPIPQQPTAAPLVPQKTGPPPPVRFGVNPAANKLTPQPTGRRANLSQATPQNPFGF
ncbi:hypothetical protein NA57DRAFT_37499 [Rhizodiscina lignyota]|uniref:Actin cytoskeleton-regulatory complex protein SLA1 n=1 Tax=Rhizodiscina lignyota TaxID=1504668 RepID=A0A9P4M6C0_9PEZI|nr:hypothetical protein NA57DRAFT_37499 [Rhizodiscina lignyota]